MSENKKLEAAAQSIESRAERSLRQVEEALAELEREYQVRERCFPKWISEGRISKIDARDRLQRQKYAIEIVQCALDTLSTSVQSADAEQ